MTQNVHNSVDFFTLFTHDSCTAGRFFSIFVTRLCASCTLDLKSLFCALFRLTGEEKDTRAKEQCRSRTEGQIHNKTSACNRRHTGTRSNTRSAQDSNNNQVRDRKKISRDESESSGAREAF